MISLSFDSRSNYLNDWAVDALNSSPEYIDEYFPPLKILFLGYYSNDCLLWKRIDECKGLKALQRQTPGSSP